MRSRCRSRAVDAVADRLAGFEGEVCSWLVGEPCFAPPAELSEGLKRAVEYPHHGYTPVAGLPELRQAVAAYHAPRGCGTSARQVTITHGAKSGLLAVIAALIQAGDRVLLPVPCYPAYKTLVELCGGTAVAMDMGGDRFHFDPQQLEEHCDERTLAILLSSPCNPTGATLHQDAAEGLVDFCRRKSMRLLSDEAYHAFRFAGDTVASAAAFDPSRSTVIQLRSFSKTYSVCGWRIGYVIADAQSSARIAAAQGGLLNPPNTLAQMALTNFSSVPETYLEMVRRTVQERVQKVADALRSCGLSLCQPEGGFYLMVDLRETLEGGRWRDTVHFCTELARSQGVGLWPGEDFQAPGWVRVSAVAGCQSELEARLEALTQGLRTLLHGDR